MIMILNTSLLLQPDDDDNDRSKALAQLNLKSAGWVVQLEELWGGYRFGSGLLYCAAI